MNAAHPTAEQIDRYRRRASAPEELLSVDSHVAECDICHATLGARAASETFVMLAEEPREEPVHITYEEMEAFIDSRMSEVERELVEGHTETCALCRRELVDLRRARSTPAAPAPTARKWESLRRPLAIAAAAVVVLAAASLWLVLEMNGPAPARPRQVVTETAPGSTPQPPVVRTIALPPGLPREVHQEIQRALRTGVMEKPARLASLRGESSPLLGGSTATVEPQTPAFSLLSPVGTFILDSHPSMRWEAVPDATYYRVTVVDAESGKIIAAGGTHDTTVWQPLRNLRPGVTYSWQVTAHRPGDDVVAPTPPAPEALFRVATEQEAGELSTLQKQLAATPLAWGIVLSERGYLDEAEAILQRTIKSEPLAKPYLEQLRGWRTSKQAPTAAKPNH